MLRPLQVPPPIGAVGFVTFLVLLPFAALVLGVLVVALLSSLR